MGCVRSLVLRGRAEQFDGVLSCGVAECRGIDRCRVREAAFAGWFAGGGREVLKSRWGGDLQDPQWFLWANDEGVRQPHGKQDEVARPGLECLPVAAELRAAGQHVEHLIFFQVPVQRWGEPGRVEELGHREAAAGAGSGGLEGDEVAEEPQGFPSPSLRR